MRGGVMTIENHQLSEHSRFRTQDIVWALGVWSVILGLTPIVLFYMLMVN